MSVTTSARVLLLILDLALLAYLIAAQPVREPPGGSRPMACAPTCLASAVR